MTNHKKSSEDSSLKGTLVATMGVGVIIILVWVYCFDLYIGRF